MSLIVVALLLPAVPPHFESGCLFLLSSQQPADLSSEWFETGVSLLILAGCTVECR
jgi:hypothetical protein